jgi:hypothetical protein
MRRWRSLRLILLLEGTRFCGSVTVHAGMRRNWRSSSLQVLIESLRRSESLAFDSPAGGNPLLRFRDCPCEDAPELGSSSLQVLIESLHRSESLAFDSPAGGNPLLRFRDSTYRGSCHVSSKISPANSHSSGDWQSPCRTGLLRMYSHLAE